MFVSNTTRKEVTSANTGAAKIVKVEGGYMVFECMSDYQVWKNQK